MNVIVKDFFQLGFLRILTMILKSLRGLFIITSLRPSLLGEYTIWLLYVFYFSFLELGIIHGLERDLSHFRGAKDHNACRSVGSTGWSLYFYLSILASLTLAAVSYFVFGRWLLSLLLACNLLAEKLSRAYETHSRILFKYNINGTAELIEAVVGFVLIYFYLPKYGIYSIFASFILSLVISTAYLACFCRLEFEWSFQTREAFEYIKSTFPLALITYAIELFNAIPVTLVAFLWDKTTLGYFSFSFRIFQICLAVFPLLIGKVMRTRLYFQMAEKENKNKSLQQSIFSMSIYGLTVAIFWLAVYWWGAMAAARFVPAYQPSIGAMNILLFSLLPLGINKISSDYLCSRVHNKLAFVNVCWLLGIAVQAAGILFARGTSQGVLYAVPMVYVVTTFAVYFCVVGTAFKIGQNWQSSTVSMAQLLAPLLIAFSSVVVARYFWHWLPALSVNKNMLYSSLSMGSTLALSVLLIRAQKSYRY